ncbi:hypothetical protein L596_030264 [Steinernema carpocapsae]|uniref:Uncharacterized protein n=1 Tax=Steinernema carpocapsae TaxID=34508 RepID=A0A4U5LNX9_STECR|nr:hypothetical protein L596_030264 [Steinernema carpocapsae]
MRHVTLQKATAAPPMSSVDAICLKLWKKKFGNQDLPEVSPEDKVEEVSPLRAQFPKLEKSDSTKPHISKKKVEEVLPFKAKSLKREKASQSLMCRQSGQGRSGLESLRRLPSQ